MKVIFKTVLLSTLIQTLSFTTCVGWGFYAHQKINRMAVYALPASMFKFYKTHIDYITEKATLPDKRRYILKDEAAKHFIDLEDYGDSALYKLPKYYSKISQIYSADSLQKLGIVPWHIQKVCFQLSESFKVKDLNAILKYSADLGHYIADANVPLHTTKNYNGQLTNQHGIHGFWESRLPELFSNQYQLFTEKARYIDNVADYAWTIVSKANACLDSVLSFEQQLNNTFDPDKKFAHEKRGAITIKVYSKSYADAYHQLLDGQVERQMRNSIQSIADLWYTCWINAGQPDLSTLFNTDQSEPNDVDENLPLPAPLEVRPEANLHLEELHSCAYHHYCESSFEIVHKEMKSKWWKMLTLKWN
jgi:hypothetical protein